ncbi:MAG: type II secretion system protein [Patescibacteria group bacterium]|nr:type II secretion system GspH family protein [Patescibacteria group bacterium]
MNKGFTLLELNLTIAILVIITAGLLISYPNLSAITSLKKTSQDMALAIREAQVYSLGVKAFGAAEYYRGYGIHFDITQPSSLIIFSDINDDKDYQAGEELQTLAIQTKDKIGALCGENGGPEDCTLTQLDIIFLRPNPIVILQDESDTEYDKASIVLKSPRGQEKRVNVWLTGQIEISN